jgi:hypothetical protein
MDMSFSGILSYIEDVIELVPHLKLPDPEPSEHHEDLERRKRKKGKQQR